MKNKFVKGFTLVELLVVIAIIGVLSSVVLSSVQSARTKAADASVKANLAGARTQADLFYDYGNTYVAVCTNAALADGTKSIYNQIVAAGTATGLTSADLVTTLTTVGAYNKITCHILANGSAYAVEAPLKASTSAAPSMYCVDSTGAAKAESAVMLASATSCV